MAKDMEVGMDLDVMRWISVVVLGCCCDHAVHGFVKYERQCFCRSWRFSPAVRS